MSLPQLTIFKLTNYDILLHIMIQVSGAEGNHCEPCPQSDHVLLAEAAGAGPEVCASGPRAGPGEAPVR